jgi:hypothetical protein
MARWLSGHRDVCPRCGNEWAHVYVVSDEPLIEESRCADCQHVISINGKRQPLMEESCMVQDGQGRR